MSEDSQLQTNVDKVQAISAALLKFLVESYPDERPDIGLMGILDGAVRFVRLFNPEGTSIEAIDSIADVLRQMKEGEAKVLIPCNQNGCEEPATHWYVWPTDGERKHSCAVHTQKAVSLAHVLGYEVRAQPMVTQPDPEPMGG
jgi:hypothetical protein